MSKMDAPLGFERGGTRLVNVGSDATRFYRYALIRRALYMTWHYSSVVTRISGRSRGRSGSFLILYGFGGHYLPIAQLSFPHSL